MAQVSTYWFIYKDPLLTYLLVTLTVPSILTLRYIKWRLGYIHSKNVASQRHRPGPPPLFWIFGTGTHSIRKELRFGVCVCVCASVSLKINSREDSWNPNGTTWNRKWHFLIIDEELVHLLLAPGKGWSWKRNLRYKRQLSVQLSEKKLEHFLMTLMLIGK